MTLSLLLTTVAKKSDARRLANASLQNRSAACIQIIPGIESHFIWKGKKSACREFLVLAKTTTRKLRSLEILWKKIHPYECPDGRCFCLLGRKTLHRVYVGGEFRSAS